MMLFINRQFSFTRSEKQIRKTAEDFFDSNRNYSAISVTVLSFTEKSSGLRVT